MPFALPSLVAGMNSTCCLQRPALTCTLAPVSPCHSRTSLFSLSCVLMSNCPSLLGHSLCKHALLLILKQQNPCLDLNHSPPTSLVCLPLQRTPALSSPRPLPCLLSLLNSLWSGFCLHRSTEIALVTHPTTSLLLNPMANSQSLAYANCLQHLTQMLIPFVKNCLYLVSSA